jgi:imidazolonepropionase
MRASQKSTRERLLDLGRKRLRRLIEHGNTTVEIKTGFGLSLESKSNMLECIYDLAKRKSQYRRTNIYASACGASASG